MIQQRSKPESNDLVGALFRAEAVPEESRQTRVKSDGWADLSSGARLVWQSQEDRGLKAMTRRTAPLGFKAGQDEWHGTFF